MGREYTRYQAAERPNRLFRRHPALNHQAHSVQGLDNTTEKNGESKKETEEAAHGLFFLSHSLTRVRGCACQAIKAGCMQDPALFVDKIYQ